MAFPTAVNSQITDAVTQANTKTIGESPAIAMGNLFQSTSQALASAAFNATYAQQQFAVTVQAATTMCVALICSVDTDHSAEGIKANLDNAKASLDQTLAAANVTEQVDEAVHAALHNVLGSAGDFSYGTRAVMDAFASSLAQLSANTHRTSMDVIRAAATATTLAAMIKSPENAGSYEKVLELIKRM
ncbi:MAG TPA: RebB family R body protein [Cellvibrio sp.]